MKITVNDAGFRRRQAAMRAGVPGAARAAVIGAVDAVVDRLVMDSPRDTNRYVRAWQQAGMQAGGKLRALPAVVRGRFATYQIGRLEKQVKWVQEQIRWRSQRFERWTHDKNGKPKKAGGWVRAERRRIYSLINLLERAKEELRKADSDGESFIFIGKGYGRRLETVRTKVYGGVGTSTFSKGIARARIRSLEPHVKIVESRMHVLANAVATANPRAVADRIFMARMRAAAGGVGGVGGVRTARAA